MSDKRFRIEGQYAVMSGRVGPDGDTLRVAYMTQNRIEAIRVRDELNKVHDEWCEKWRHAIDNYSKLLEESRERIKVLEEALRDYEQIEQALTEPTAGVPLEESARNSPSNVLPEVQRG